MASNEHTVLLTAYKSVTQDFTVFSEHILVVAGVYYSNDGESDNVSVSVDGRLVETFETMESFGEGFLWNVFHNTGMLGNSISIRPGDHELQILVTSEDVNGVEIDSIIMELNCSHDHCDEGYNTCPASVIVTQQYGQQENEDERLRVLLSSSENTLGLAGVIIGSGLGLINTCIIVVMAVHKLRKRKEKTGVESLKMPFH